MSPCQDTVILETRNLTREIKKNGNIIKAVDGISYLFNKGRIYNIVGPEKRRFYGCLTALMIRSKARYCFTVSQ